MGHPSIWEKIMINLHGNWNYMIDLDNVGIQHEFYKTTFKSNPFIMPGTTNQNKIGTKLDESKLDEKEKVKCLREHYNYTGVMWYQKTVDITEDFLDGEVELFLERVMFESSVYVNGKHVGKNTSLSTPHQYLIGAFLTKGINTITLRIDNNDSEGIGVYASAMTIDTSTVWNGVVGKMELVKKPLIDLKNIQIFPDYDQALIKIQFQGINYNEEKNDTVLHIQAVSPNKNHDQFKTQLQIVHDKEYQITYHMKDFLKWDEFTPNMYQLEMILNETKKTIPFGMRKLETKDRQIIVNNRPTFLLGTLECCIFPLTGYPETTRPYW